MEILKFQNETSERSEPYNWVKAEVSTLKDFYFAGFEGCNENSSNLVTAMMDRAVIEFSGDPNENPLEKSVLEHIVKKEGRSLQGKINFCRRLNIPYTYILYCYDPELVLRYEITENSCKLRERYCSFKKFSEWIMTIKGWKSNKAYEKKEDLPAFDNALRKAGCPWPTNIDCIAFSSDNQPVAIIEYQNTENENVSEHFNNYYYLSHHKREGDDYRNTGLDEQRWKSQELLRLQSLLPHFTIVWSKNEDVTIVKVLDEVVFPNYNYETSEDRQKYIKDLDSYAEKLKTRPKLWKNDQYQIMRKNYSSYQFRFDSGLIKRENHSAPLDLDKKTFPFLYGKRLITVKKGEVKEYMYNLLSSL